MKWSLSRSHIRTASPYDATKVIVVVTSRASGPGTVQREPCAVDLTTLGSPQVGVRRVEAEHPAHGCADWCAWNPTSSATSSRPITSSSSCTNASPLRDRPWSCIWYTTQGRGRSSRGGGMSMGVSSPSQSVDDGDVGARRHRFRVGSFRAARPMVVLPRRNRRGSRTSSFTWPSTRGADTEATMGGCPR